MSGNAKGRAHDLTDAPPTRLADPVRLRRVLTGAGLTDVNVITTNWPMAMRSVRRGHHVTPPGSPAYRRAVANWPRRRLVG